MQPRENLIDTLKQRELFYQCSSEEGLAAALDGGVVKAYIGFDPTASSLHIGSLIQILLLRWLQRLGHKPVVLMGGGTGLVGDPSFRDSSRPIISQSDIDDNCASILKVFSRFIRFGDGPTDAIVLNNATWLTELNYIEFLRDYGPHFSINRMLTFDSVRLRLEREQSLTFLEFNYMLLQAFDYLHLSREHGVSLQMGGSDQWGNIINGVELCRRAGNTEVFALTSPLLTTASGSKMGKTAQGAIWLNEDLTSAFDYWQYWRNTDDADVIKFMKIFTDLSLSEIEQYATLEGGELNRAKIELANLATAMLHGEAKSASAQASAQASVHGVASGHSDKSGLTQYTTSKQELVAGLGLLHALVLAQFASSTSDGRRSVKGGAVKLNGANITDERYVITLADIDPDGEIILSIGKKRVARILFT